MVIIKLRGGFFKSSKLYESDAIIEMLKVIGRNKFKILEITGQIPPIKIKQKSYLERINEVKMSKL